MDGAWWRTHWVTVIAADPPEVSPRSIASRTTATRAASQAMPRASTSPNSPDKPSGPPPEGACHSTDPSADTAERAAAILLTALRQAHARVLVPLHADNH